MARAVLQAVRNSENLCVEAGTGTGKTLAYLIPALTSTGRVVVSTSTRNLQEQLFFRDLPLIREHVYPDIEVAYMKGRQNYLCLKRLKETAQMRRLFPERADEVRQRLTEWAAETKTGDRAELDWLADDDPVWSQVDARSDLCTGQNCAFFQDCFVTRMRRRALAADLIIVNHALLFASLALENDEIGKILPDFSVAILDEAHDVENIAADFFGHRISNFQMEELSRDLVQDVERPERFEELLLDLSQKADGFFHSFPSVEGRHSLNYFRRPDGVVCDLREDCFAKYQKLVQAMASLYHRLQAEADCSETLPLIRRLERMIEVLEKIFEVSGKEQVCWFEKRGRGTFLHLTPIKVSDLLRKNLFDRVDSTILTSATLAIQGSFSYIRDRLGVPDPIEIVVPNEFDFPSQAMLYVPRSLPEPRTAGYFLRMLREVKKLLDITGGDAFCLFTSFTAMNQVADILEDDGAYVVLRQGSMPRSRLLEKFRQTPGTVLCGTASFWQGVDVRGEALRSVIIDKLPFGVPTDPIASARMQQLRNEGRNAFQEYAVPGAIIALKQGLGRLIRSRDDHGILAVLDSRLWTRRYGRQFVDSLPNCRVTDNIKILENFYRQTASDRVRESTGKGENLYL